MAAYSAPGVYYERVDASAPAIAAIRTDLAGFVGLARRGPLDTPVPVQSWRQFQAYFGEFTGAAFLAYAVRAFFENGGRRCWVVRVASRDELGGAATAGLTLYGRSGEPIWRVAAFSPGVWGNDLSVLVQETSRAQTVTVPDGGPPDASTVASTAGFTRGTLVRLTQGNVEQWHVVSDVDAVTSRLVWLHPKPEARLPYDRPLVGFAVDQPIVIASVEYNLFVRELGRPVALFEGLALVPEHDRYGPRVLAPLVSAPTVTPPMTVPVAPPPVVIEELRNVAVWQAVRPAPVEPLQVAARTTLQSFSAPDRVELGSVGGVTVGATLELLDPLAASTVVGPPLTVLFIDPASANTVLLASGLSATQQAAHGAAVGAGTRLIVRALNLSSVDLPLSGGRDGLALLTATDFMGEPVSPLDSDQVRAARQRGIRALERVNEVAIVAVPDINIQPLALPPKAPPPACVPDPCLPAPALPAAPRAPSVGELPPTFSDDEVYRVQAALVLHCEERRDRIAVLDAPLSAARDDRLGVGPARAWRTRFDSKYAAFYFPWLHVVDPLRSGTALTRLIPPSGHVAGQYARSDLTVGVHKAPANVPLVWAEDVSVAVDEATHGVLNPLGINAIRALAGRGLRIMGARTVSSDPDWRFVNVRRLLMMIEEAVDLATQWVVFEPNDVITRAKVSLALTSFLLTLWQQGALAGATADEAFFVRCDEELNPPSERANGRLVALVGVAPSYPFEFIVLRVGRTGNELEIAELSVGGGSWRS